MQSRYILCNRILDGKLDERLRLWHLAKLSNPAISRLLYLETGVQISKETIRGWRQILEAA